MKTIWKIVVLFVVAGLALSFIGVALGGSKTVYLDKTGVHLETYNKTRIIEPDLGHFKNIDIDVAYSGVEFVSSDKYGIEIYSDDGEWAWSLNSETLSIKQQQETKARISFFDFNLDMDRKSSHIKVYFPANAEFESVSVKTDSGDVDVGGFNADNVKINNSYGKAVLNTLTADNLQIDINSGNFTGADLNIGTIVYTCSYGKGDFERVNAQNFLAESNSVNITLKACRVSDIDIKNSYGKIIADGLYSAKTNIYVNSGEINLQGEFSGETVIRSSYGGVNFSTTKEKAYYDYDISAKYGKITLDGENLGSDVAVKSGGASDNKLNITVESGDIKVYFKS